MTTILSPDSSSILFFHQRLRRNPALLAGLVVLWIMIVRDGPLPVLAQVLPFLEEKSQEKPEEEMVVPPTLIPTAPVILDGETLFQVRGVSAYPAEERARRVLGPN